VLFTYVEKTLNVKKFIIGVMEAVEMLWIFILLVGVAGTLVQVFSLL
jgi:hypothetical protein